MDEIDAQAKALKGEIQSEMTSSVSKMAKMPLFGATVIAQAESWNEDDERYEVAVLVCWSNTLHRAARAIATGEDFRVKPRKNKGNVNEWLKKQDLAVMSGPRQYLDKDGKRWFLGISARALPKASSQRRKAKSLTEMFASQMAVFCVYADLASQKTASQMMQTRNAGKMDSTQVAESMAETLTQQFKNKTVRGLVKLMSKEMVHPISGETIYISIYGINPTFAKQAQALEAKNYATAVQSNLYQSEEKGRKAGLEAEV
jgi:rubrerythrin